MTLILFSEFPILLGGKAGYTPLPLKRQAWMLNIPGFLSDYL